MEDINIIYIPFKIEYFDRGFRDAIMPRNTVTARGRSKFNATSPYASLSPFPVCTNARRGGRGRKK